MTFSEFWDMFVKGFADMLPIIILLISALTFQKIASEMEMTEFFVDLCKPIMSGTVFPMIAFIIVIAFTNLFMYSASAKWMILAPIFVPMFMNLGVNPAVTQCLYRIGDSCTNNLTPLNAALVYAITLMNDYRVPEINKEEAGIGTLLSGQVVFSLVYLVVLIVLFCVFYFCNIPLGLGV